MLEQVIKWQTDRNLDKMHYDYFNEHLNIFEELLEMYDLDREYAKEVFLDRVVMCSGYTVSRPKQIDAYFDICVYAIGAMLKLGYDPIKVFKEGLKEINELTGKYDPKVGKWVKGEKKPNAYKADYSKAKR